DHIEDEHGKRQADVVLATIRSICTWYATRDDDYIVPIVKGMRRGSNGARERILDDAELRAVWKAAEASGTFCALVQFGPLTAQRKAILLGLRRSDIDAKGVWSIPHADREKGNGGPELVLPKPALAILRRLPPLHDNDFVFAPARGKTLSASHGLAELKAKL